MTFSEYVALFPVAEFPIHLGEESYKEFEKIGQLLPDGEIATYLAELELELDEFTEVLACAQFSRKGYTALIYWKAGLLHNHYRILTYDPQGSLVDNRVVAGSYVDGEKVSFSAATITADAVIYVVSGQQGLNERLGSADANSALRLGIDDSGVIRELEMEE